MSLPCCCACLFVHVSLSRHKHACTALLCFCPQILTMLVGLHVPMLFEWCVQKWCVQDLPFGYSREQE